MKPPPTTMAALRKALPGWHVLGKWDSGSLQFEISIRGPECDPMIKIAHSMTFKAIAAIAAAYAAAKAVEKGE